MQGTCKFVVFPNFFLAPTPLYFRDEGFITVQNNFKYKSKTVYADGRGNFIKTVRQAIKTETIIYANRCSYSQFICC